MPEVASALLPLFAVAGSLRSALSGFSQLVRPMNADAKIADNFVFGDGLCLVGVMLLCLVKNFLSPIEFWVEATARKVFKVFGGFDMGFICLTNNGCSPEPAAHSFFRKG